ncbi:hypothetical protein [Pseudobdellovibrio sp. HCB154]|uniref:hypothetical protein n=1 Tax=Pseudobdellovibrio sp. HCB154 TaxID=3386277 RepID=UPI0039175D96
MLTKGILGILVSITWLSSHVFFSKSYDRFQEPYIPPPKAIQYLTAGFKVQTADAFWLRAVQDFDYCSKKIAENVCEGNSWLFSVLDLSSTLDSRLEPVMYQTGGLALSILVGDIEGAATIFSRGVRVYPDNWQIIYGAAYHALYEEKNKKKAAKLYLRAFENGAPSWTQVLAARLASDEGEREFAEKVLEDMIAQNKDENLVKRLKTKLEETKSQKH